MEYVTSAKCTGGREGRSILQDGGFGVAMAYPKAIGGDGQGSNPEQLFALGYASCFNSALLAVSKKHGADLTRASVTATVTLTKDDVSFALSVALDVHLPGIAREQGEALIADAHAICPYSRATRGNVPVTLTLV